MKRIRQYRQTMPPARPDRLRDSRLGTPAGERVLARLDGTRQVSVRARIEGILKKPAAPPSQRPGQHRAQAVLAPAAGSVGASAAVPHEKQ